MISCQPLKRATSTPSATGATRSSVNLELSPVSLVLLFARVSRELGPVSLHTSQRSTVEKTTDRVGSVLSSDTSFCKKMHLGEIARIVLPTDWAMCEVFWYGMVLLAHPHGYPHTMHIFCGQREWGWQLPDPLSPFPSRRFM